MRIRLIASVCALTLVIAAGCSDDESPDASGGAGDGMVAGAPGAAGMPSDPGGASFAGAAGGDAGSSGGASGGAAGDGGSGAGAEGGAEPLASSTVLDVNDVKDHPEPYDWFDFRPNVKKLILAGEAETEHIAILWYTVTDGGVGLHYHSKTESVYVIDGTQTDAKGVYGNGTVYFNPPGSGHQITDSSGFFILAYAAPPDFVNTDLIEAYEPVRIDTAAPDLLTAYEFTEYGEGIQTYAVPLADEGGLQAELIETSSTTPYAFDGNYLLVLDGNCVVEGVDVGEGTLIVSNTVVPQSYAVNGSAESTCLVLGVSF